MGGSRLGCGSVLTEPLATDFDDPKKTYRVLYASSQRLGCFLETLARFRADPQLLAELAEIDGDDDYTPAGEVPIEWAEKRMMGSANAEGEYADICSSEWISRLRKLLAPYLRHFGVEDLDASVLQQNRSARAYAVRI